jgi:stage III sporulation protein AD
MELFWQICGISAVGVVAAVTLRGLRNEWSGPIRAATFLCVGAAVLQQLLPTVQAVREWGAEIGNASAPGVDALLRAVGIAYLTWLCGSVCRDCGEAGMAGGIELAGKLAVLELALPLLRHLTALAREVLEWV